MATLIGGFILASIFLGGVFISSFKRKQWEYAIPSGLIMLLMCGFAFAVLASIPQT